MAARIGDYEIIGRDPCGGAGLPYLVRDARSSATSTLKVLPELSAGQEQYERVCDLVNRLRRVEHPNVLAPTECKCDANGSVYVVSPSVDCTSLARLLEQGQLTNEQTREIGLAVARGLASAHEAGVVHGALQPRSVLLPPDGPALVTDFGLRSVLPEHASAPFLPSPEYFAPELGEQSNVTAAGDAFALGVLMRGCLAGATSGAEGTAGSLERVIDGLVAADPALRFSLRRAIEILDPQDVPVAPVAARPSYAPHRRDVRLLYGGHDVYDADGNDRRARTIALVAIGVVALVAATAAMFATASVLDDRGDGRDEPLADATNASTPSVPTAIRRDEAVAPVVVTPQTAAPEATSEPTAVDVAEPTLEVFDGEPDEPPEGGGAPAPSQPQGHTEQQLAEAIALRADGNSRFYRSRDVADIAEAVTGSALRTYEIEAARLRAIDAYIDSTQTDSVIESIQYSVAYAQVTTVETWEHVDRRASTGEAFGSRRAQARITYGLIYTGERWLVESINHTILSITPL